MSSFNCEHCGKLLQDTPGKGYITECDHYKMEKTEGRARLMIVNNIIIPLPE